MSKCTDSRTRMYFCLIKQMATTKAEIVFSLIPGCRHFLYLYMRCTGTIGEGLAEGEKSDEKSKV